MKYSIREREVSFHYCKNVADADAKNPRSFVGATESIRSICFSEKEIETG